jgi:hypothetical protein
VGRKFLLQTPAQVVSLIIGTKASPLPPERLGWRLRYAYVALSGSSGWRLNTARRRRRQRAVTVFEVFEIGPLLAAFLA